MRTTTTKLERDSQSLYRDALEILRKSGVPFMVGGAYALRAYTGIHRNTRDFDVFVLPEDCPRALDTFATAGFEAELVFPHWLGKCRRGEDYVDIIFSSGNGIAKVDAEWLEHAGSAEFFDQTVRICPAEEMIWSKAFVQERERYDGADVAHLIRARGAALDWDRLVRRFRPHPHVLLAHLLLFEFVFPDQHDVVPQRVRRELLALVDADAAAPRDAAVCRGTLLSRSQYLTDLEHGYGDARLRPFGPFDPRDLEKWTEEAESL